MSDHRTLVSLVFAAISLWLIALVSVVVVLPDWQSRGQFGDLFGAINALFSGLAFAGIFYAILLQQRQLSLQRTELQLQRTELALQREEMVASRGELRNQVEVQRAMYKAATAQIAVSAMVLQAEAHKLRSVGEPQNIRDANAGEIERLSAALSELSNHLQGEGRSSAA